ncbi:MAG: M15 family metallopeptidase [Clostridia bacterium]|nr:M15 family metallopeptidase [Clostridia bacterium]
MGYLNKKNVGLIVLSCVVVLVGAMLVGYVVTRTVAGRTDGKETTLYTTTDPLSTTEYTTEPTTAWPPVFTTAPATSAYATLYPGDTAPYTSAYATLYPGDTAPYTASPYTTAYAPPVTTGVYNILDDENIAALAEPTVINIREDLWFLALVNNQYAMPADYPVNTAPAVPGSDVHLETRVAEKYTEMYNAAALDGIYLTPCSGYRSYERQKNNYERKTQYFISQGYNETEAKAKAAMIIMPPGCSEHNLGLAMDIIATNDNFYTTPEYAWLCAHAEEYGFILRYPKDKQFITKVEYEPWHWRYVGADFAKAINASNMCLEEYLAAAGLLPTPYVVNVDSPGVG